ncbi:MAG: type IV pilus assembly protein PilM [Patescibacteria group bacterium]
MGFFSSNKSYLGIDIGSTSVKLVELKKDKGVLHLVTYGFTEFSKDIEKTDWLNDYKYMARIIRKVWQEANATSRLAVSALPTFSVFSSILNLPNINEKEIDSAIHWEAKKVIPLPLEDMVLDWKIIPSTNENNKKSNKILLTGAPKSLVKKYINIFQTAEISLLSLETETFSLIRSLIGNDKSTIMVAELGANTTDISIISNSIPVLNRSIDVGGVTITKAISNNLNIGRERAEQFKHDLGLNLIKEEEEVIPKTIIEAINPVINEIKYMLNLYQDKNNKKVEKIILSGGSALLPNFSDYLAKILDINVIVGDPWARISYPVDLKPVLKEIGPMFSVAVGLAIREIE